MFLRTAARRKTHSASARIDTPSADQYYAGELPRITGFSLSQTVRLELLGAHPESVCDYTVWGPAWDKEQIDDFVSFLAKNPDYRELLFLLIGEVPPEAPNASSIDGETA